jgi:hypothetical protein
MILLKETALSNGLILMIKTSLVTEKTMIQKRKKKKM